MSLFFEHLFSKVNLKVNHIFTGKHTSYQFPQTWRSHLTCENIWSQLYKKVIQACCDVSLVVCFSQIIIFTFVPY